MVPGFHPVTWAEMSVGHVGLGLISYRTGGQHLFESCSIPRRPLQPPDRHRGTPPVEMDPVPHGLHVRKNSRYGPAPPGRAQHRIVAGHLVQGPVHRLAPESGHGPRIRTVDDHRGDRPGVPVGRPRLQHAELVARRAGQDRSRDVALWPTRRRASRRDPGGVRPGPPDGLPRWWRDRVHAVLHHLGSGTARTSMPTAVGSG
jgi:hypothetical protein